MTTDRNPEAPPGFGKRRRAETEKAAPKGPTLFERLRRVIGGSKPPQKNNGKRRKTSRGG